MGEKLNNLRAEIPMNGEVQSFFDGLDEDASEQLAGFVSDALANQSQRLDEAGEHAVRMVPRVFRGPVKKMLFGEQD